MKTNSLLKTLGPGLLYAGAAVGVSHLVQSTRAGADYGFDLLLILIFANVIKYPFFEFGSRYAAATEKNLIEGYQQIGKWAVVLFGILTLGTMFTIQAAVTIVTAGLIGNAFNIPLNPVWISAFILTATMIILMIGRYAVLDKLIKYIITLLAISTIIAVVAAFTKGFNPDPDLATHFNFANRLDIFFLIAFIGWMPAPIDITVWQSLWINAKQKKLKKKPEIKNVLLDFKIGYIGTAFLAICFLSLGAFVVYGTGTKLSPSGTVFAGQLISMYTDSIGSWSHVFISIAAITIMFSTTLTCLDGYPRVMIPLTTAIFSSKRSKKWDEKRETWVWLILVVSGSLIVMGILSSTMRTMVDIATTLSFVTAPFLAYLNYRVVTGRHMPRALKPNRWLRIYAWVGIGFLSVFTLFYLVWSFL